MRTIGIWILILSMLAIQLYSQDDGVSSAVREHARSAFSNSDYQTALKLYRDLLNTYPKEPEYLYSTAVCLINLNRNLDEAIQLLKPASVNEYSRLSSYYLGRALHLNYAFEDAIKSYSKYLLNYKGGEPRREHVERLIEMVRNGIEYTRSGNSFQVQFTEILDENQLESSTSINGTGRLMRKPVEFCSKTDIRNSYRPWMFLPSYTEINEYIYTAGYDGMKKNGKQLFRIKNINHETWGIPELLDNVINTPYDEEFPFFDTRTSTLYFSSNGHSSMGGYDIFKSVYNWNTKKWSEPENLGFPINSPYDDFVYVTDGFGNTVSFVSTRATEPGKVTLYRLRLEKEAKALQFGSVEELKKASLLEKTSLTEIEPLSEKVTPASIPGAKKPDSTGAVQVVKPATGNYNKILAEALRLQLRADSAARITRDLRIMAKEMPGDSLRKELVDEILKNDKLAKNLQREADAKFAEARKLRPETATSTDDSVVQFNKEINGIRIYQYRPDANIETVVHPANPVKSEKPAPPPSKPTDQFKVLDKPAYSDFNPIPKGLTSDTGLIYRVQLGVFSRAKPNDAFGGISPVGYEQSPGSAMLKYYAGLFYGYNSVSKALEIIRGMGFTDAFIVAFLNGETISVEKAKEIEFAGFKL